MWFQLIEAFAFGCLDLMVIVVFFQWRMETKGSHQEGCAISQLNPNLVWFLLSNSLVSQTAIFWLS